MAAQFEVPLSTSDAQEVVNNNLEQNLKYFGERGYNIYSLFSSLICLTVALTLNSRLDPKGPLKFWFNDKPLG